MTALEIQIKRIIENLTPDKAASEILRLFSVVGRSEQLACTFCGINPMTEICKHPKVCSTKEKVKAN
jgi:hypothetical protein